MPPFEIGLDEIARQQQRQNDEADQVQIDQQKDKGVPVLGRKESDSSPSGMAVWA